MCSAETPSRCTFRWRSYVITQGASTPKTHRSQAEPSASSPKTTYLGPLVQGGALTLPSLCSHTSCSCSGKCLPLGMGGGIVFVGRAACDGFVKSSCLIT